MKPEKPELNERKPNWNKDFRAGYAYARHKEVKKQTRQFLALQEQLASKEQELRHAITERDTNKWLHEAASKRIKELEANIAAAVELKNPYPADIFVSEKYEAWRRAWQICHDEVRKILTSEERRD